MDFEWSHAKAYGLNKRHDITAYDNQFEHGHNVRHTRPLFSLSPNRHNYPRRHAPPFTTIFSSGEVDQWVQTEAFGWRDAPYVNMSINGVAINRTLGVFAGHGVHRGPSWSQTLTQIMPSEHKKYKKYCFKLFYMTSFQHWPLWHLRDITGLESSNSIILRPKSHYEYESPTQIVKWGDDLGCAEIPAPTPKQHQRGWECEKSETFTVLVMRNISFYTFTP